MWSGPRNLSTAMMYAFGNRADFSVWDEPFYAPYLRATGMDHPMRDDVIAHHETDAQAVAARCTGEIPNGKRHFYMKHMPFHMQPGFPLDWAEDCVNVHLIRHPARVVASYAAKRENPTMRDIGYEAQTQLFDRLPGPVLDSADVRQDPAGVLRRLCNEIGLNFDPAMLTWPEGPKSFDGVWAVHWYGSVHRSTGFAGAERELPKLQDSLAALAEAALPHYERLAELKI